MFFGHHSQIYLERDEPKFEDFELAKDIVRKRHARLCQAIVMKDTLREAKSEKAVQKSILSVLETDERKKAVSEFMEIWNEWRKFYFEAPAMEPKTKGQLTAIENAMTIANENGIALSVFIACTHKAYAVKFKKSGSKPGFTTLVAYGLDNYEQFKNTVHADIAKDDYEERSWG